MAIGKKNRATRHNSGRISNTSVVVDQEGFSRHTGEQFNSERFVKDALDRRFQYFKKVIENTGETKELAKDGYWLVPVEERPKGWEKMGIKEREI